MTSQSNPYFNDYQITQNHNSPYNNGLNQFAYQSTEQINLEQQQKTHQSLPSTVDDTSSTNIRNDPIVYKDDYFKNYKNINNHLMNSISLNHTDFINPCESELWNRHKDTWMNPVPNSTPTPPPPTPTTTTTRREETPSEKIPYVQQFNKTERCRSPNCHCSCHLPTTKLEQNYSTTQNSNQHTPYSLSLKDNIMAKKINDALYKQNNLDELPTKLHNERHTINMKRLGEQLTRVNRLNAAVSYSNHHHNNNNGSNTYLPVSSDPTNLNNQRCEYNVNYDDSNSRDYHKVHTRNPAPSELKTPPEVNTTYNNNNKSNITSPLGLSSTSPMSDSKCVWMPVPVTMLNSWFNLLSNITCPSNNDNTTTTTNNNNNSNNSVHQSTFIAPCTTSSSSFTSSVYNQ
ncbi:unnamed protein product [Trichobilharzia szidati]|nr:unnamed protein product [Trichobilharzia szidati]